MTSADHDKTAKEMQPDLWSNSTSNFNITTKVYMSKLPWPSSSTLTIIIYQRRSFAKSIDKVMPSQSTQTDLGQNFSLLTTDQSTSSLRWL